MVKKKNTHQAEKRKEKTERRAVERSEAARNPPAPARVVGTSPHSWEFQNRPGSLPRRITITLAQLEVVARAVSEAPIVCVAVRPEREAQELCCMQNVARKVEREGGRPCYGWTFNQRFSLHGPYIYLQHHAVWEAVDAQLADVTPRTSDPNLRPLNLDGRTVFLPDPMAVPTTDARFGVAALPSRFFPLQESEALRNYVAELNANELAAPHTLGLIRS